MPIDNHMMKHKLARYHIEFLDIQYPKEITSIAFNDLDKGLKAIIQLLNERVKNEKRA